MALARSVLGIGEATYGVIAPTILLDLFAREQRARLMSAYYLAMPIGSALGISLGSIIASKLNWHLAFFLVGAPGLAAAILAFALPEPVRGASEGVDTERLKAYERAGAQREDYFGLMVNSSYIYSVLGMAAYTFAIGGMLVWVPNYLFSTRGFDQARAGTILGVVTLGAAVLGMSAGGWIADRLAKSRPQALFLVPGVAMFGSIPFVLVALFTKSEPAIFAAIFLAEALMFVNTGTLQRDHRQRRAAKPPRGGVRHRDLRGSLPGRHLVALADRQGVRPVRRRRDDGRRVRPGLELDRRRADAGRRPAAREHRRRPARGRAGVIDLGDRPSGRGAIPAPRDGI